MFFCIFIYVYCNWQLYSNNEIHTQIIVDDDDGENDVMSYTGACNCNIIFLIDAIWCTCYATYMLSNDNIDDCNVDDYYNKNGDADGDILV